MKTLLVSVIVILALSRNVFAGPNVAQIGPFYLKSVTIIATPFGGHHAYNLEVWVDGGFKKPSNLTKCSDTNYITTLKSVDNGSMLSLLREAIIAKHQVRFWITDDPAYNAVPNRCSLVAVELL